MRFFLMAFDDVQIPKLGVCRRQTDGRIQVAGLVLYKALVVLAVVIATVKIIRRHAYPELARNDRPHQKALVWLVLPYSLFS